MSQPVSALGGLIRLFLTDATLTALVPSGVWLGEVPAEKSLPFVSIEHKGSTPNWASEGGHWEDTRVLWTVYAREAQNVGDPQPTEVIALGILAAVNNKDLGVLNAPTMKVRHSGYTLKEDKQRAPDGARVYSVEMPMMVWLDRNLTGGS